MAPYILAICVAMSSLRGALHSDIAMTDAARHAMNGAFILDWIQSGNITDSLSYAKQYYAHSPAISLPYHPPLFPAIEACLFYVFGVSVFVARVAIALSVAVCALLLFRRVAKEYGGHLLSLATVITFFFLKGSIANANDVMLEFPAFAFALAALTFLRFIDGQWRLRDGLLFAALGGAAVWTKQHAVFLGLVPFVYVILSRRWYLLRGKTLWISTALFSALVAGLLATSHIGGGVGATGQVFKKSFVVTLYRTIGYYSNSYMDSLGILLGIICALAFVVLLFQRLFSNRGSGRHDLMLSWAISVLVVALSLSQFNSRYLIYAFPPIIALGYFGVAEICRRKLSDTTVRSVVLGCVALVTVPNLLMVPTRLQGPSEAAEFVISEGATRVLYCGYYDGSFIFSVRSLGEPLECWIFRSSKMDDSTFEPKCFEAFIHHYGIQYVVLEQNKNKRPWDHLADQPISSLRLERVIELKKTTVTNKNSGSLYVYRNLNPSLEPADPTHFQLSTIGSFLGKYTNFQSLRDKLDQQSD